MLLPFLIRKLYRYINLGTLLFSVFYLFLQPINDMAMCLSVDQSASCKSQLSYH